VRSFIGQADFITPNAFWTNAVDQTSGYRGSTHNPSPPWSNFVHTE
jgi:hypothetical protein